LLRLASVRILCVLSFACAAACGSGAAGSPDAGADASGPDFPSGEPDITISQRTFDDSTATTAIDAFWTDGSLPDPYHVVDQSGPCVLREREPYGCGFDCDDGICIGDGCYPYPVGLSAGRLTVSGGDRTVEIDPVEGRYGYFEQAALFARGDRIQVSAAGADVPAFAVETRAIADLEAPGIDDLRLAAGEDFHVSWTPADPDSRVRLLLESDQHGQFSPTVIECDAVDGAGSITVPGDLVERFWATPGQCGECPSQTLTRYSRGQTTGEQPVTLEHESVIPFYPYGDPY
jgi:hypothetical protein